MNAVAPASVPSAHEISRLKSLLEEGELHSRNAAIDELLGQLTTPDVQMGNFRQVDQSNGGYTQYNDHKD